MIINFIKPIRLFFLINRLSSCPQDTKRVFDIVDYLIKTRTQKEIQKIEQKLNVNLNYQTFKRIYDNDTTITKPFDLDNLKKYPPNTLGHTLYNHYQNNNISPDFYLPLDETNDLAIIRNYLAKTHDIWHVLSGFGSSSFDEYGLQAMYLGQEVSMAAFCIMNAGVLEILKKRKPINIIEYMNKISKGWLMGKEATSMLYIIWENYLDRDIKTVRSDLQIINIVI